MKSITKNGLTLAFLFAAVMSVAFISSPDKATALDAESQQDESVVEVLEGQSETTVQEEVEATEEVIKEDVLYKYVAQLGDSYSLISRKAIQTYGLKFEVNLNLSQIMYAETMLTKEAQSPYLNLEQTIEIQESRIKYWVEESLKLSEEEQAAWNYYAQMADFNTDSVGEQQS